MRASSFLCLSAHGFHRLAFTDWGDMRSDVLICAHGLTRNGRDFDFLASVLAADYRVVCPDVAGRGRSDWLSVKEDYNYATYCADMAALMAWLHAEQVDWVGTSMGGIIGMLLAAQSQTPIRRLVLNDVGPFIPKSVLERIAIYLAADLRFKQLAGLETYLRGIHAGFGPLTDAQWSYLAEHSAKQTPDGDWALVYDPGIAQSFRARPLEDVNLWPVWNNIRCPVLVIRGAESDLLLAETVAQMRQRGPHTEVVELAGVGHAPALMSEDQIEIVRDWLKS
jgi:pimeloyl-ACP methyl ester carboxylesterase